MDTVVNEKQNKLSTYQHQDIGDKALGLRVLGWASILRMLSLEELKDPTLFGFGLTCQSPCRGVLLYQRRSGDQPGSVSNSEL